MTLEDKTREQTGNSIKEDIPFFWNFLIMPIKELIINTAYKLNPLQYLTPNPNDYSSD